MKLQEITSILAKAGLPPLPREQLLALSGTEMGKSLQAALVAVDAGAIDQVPILTRLVDAVVGGDHPHAPVQRSAPAAASRSGPAAPPYYSFHVYGRAAALCFSEAKTRSSGAATMQIEGANAMGGAGRVSYDWPNKIIIQFSEQEMYLVLALFSGKVDEVRIDGHGQAHDKFARMTRQETNFFVELGQRGRGKVAVPVGSAEAFQIVSLAHRQIRTGAPHLDASTINDAIAQVGAMYQAQRG